MTSTNHNTRYIMNTVRCIAIDDEPLALEVISKFCSRMGGVELSTFSDPFEGMAAIRDTNPDIVFLDIEMENISGLEIASQLPDDTCLIFTTAYLHYALDGFNLDAVDYLHKPFAYSRFEAAMAKAMRRIDYSRSNRPARSITVKQEYNNVTIPLNEILYVEAMEGYSKIFRDNAPCVISRVLLKNIGSMLPQQDFLRIHRSFIVSVARIESYSRQEVRLRSGAVLPVGRQYSSDIISRLMADQV